MTASTKSTVRSSAGDEGVEPELPTVSVDSLGLVGSRENRSVPVSQLSASNSKSPPIPTVATRPPVRPRMSSMLPRSPGDHRIGPLLLGFFVQELYRANSVSPCAPITPIAVARRLRSGCRNGRDADD